MKYFKKITLGLLAFIFAFIIIAKNINLKADNETYNLLTYRDTSINLEAGPGNGAFIRFQLDHPLEADQIIIKNLNKIEIDKTSVVSGLSSNFEVNGNETKLNIYTTIPNEIVVNLSENLETLSFMILAPDGVNKLLYSEYFMNTIKIYAKSNGNLVIKETPELETVTVEETYETIDDYAVRKIVLDQEKNYSFEFYNSFYHQVSFNGSTFQDLPIENITFNAYYNYYSYSYDIYVTGLEPILNVSPGFEITFRYFNNFTEVVIYSFSSLPITLGNFENGLNDIGFVNIQKINTTTYNIRVYYKEFVYLLSVNNVPEHILNSEKVYYFTDSGQRYFIGFYEYQNHYKDTSSIEQNLMDNSWIYWNLTNGQYMRSEINVIRGLIHVNSTTMLYADIVIPHNIDDLLSIVVEYDYQYKYLNGSVGAWQKVTDKYLNNDVKTHIQIPWYSSPLNFYNFILKKTNLFAQNQISKVETTAKYKESYVEKFNSYNEKLGLPNNYTVSTLFPNNSNVYRLYLGSYNKWWAIGLNVRDFGVVAYRYIYNGVEYSNPYPETEIPDYEHENPIIDGVNNFFNKGWGIFLKYAAYLIPVLALISYPLIRKGMQGVFGNKINKHRTLLFFVYLGVLYLLWFMLVR